MLRGLWGAVGVCVALVMGCGSDPAAERAALASLGDGCIINTDCSQDPEQLVCAFRLCHIKCQTSADCEPGLRCVLGDKPEHVCQLPEEVPNPPCAWDSECPGVQVCGPDGECRDECREDKDCVEGQKCVNGGVCADDEELGPNGELPNKLGDGGVQTGKLCSYDSECDGADVCRPTGFCGPECKGDKDCGKNEKCVSQVCVAPGTGPTTLPEHCKSGTKDGDESALDCGGSCLPCSSGSDCGQAGDCVSQVCTASKCQDATCSDAVRNGSETGTDCGGPSCSACPAAQTCSAPTDCTTGICKSGVCVDPTCADGLLNGNETDTDCGGGGCPACDGAKVCIIGGDCTSGVCTAFSCAQPSCNDGVKNGKETGQDCGGSDCKACSVGKGCAQNSDCVTNVCTSSSCVAATCADTVKNGNETDIDCGGSDCAKCASGKACSQATDCSAGSCVGNLCKGTYKLTVTPAGTGAGTVKSDVGGIDCGATCSADILEGTSVVLTATAASSSTFSGWSGGGCSGTGTCSFTLSADTTVTATFGGVAPGGMVWKKGGLGYHAYYRAGAVDGANNYFFIGSMTQNVDLGGGPTPTDSNEAFVVKHSPSGAWMWSRKLGGPGSQVSEQLVLEPGGDLVVIGRSSDAATLDLGGTPQACNANSVFLARFAQADGAHKWSTCVGSGVESVSAAMLDGSGNVVIAGTLLAGSTDFGTGALVAQGRDMFVASFSLSNGAAVAAKSFGGAGDDSGTDLARASDGSYVMTGACTGNMSFGNGVTTTGKGGTDLCVLRLSSSWTPTWARQLGDLQDDVARTAAFAPSGKLVVAGTFKGQVDFDAGVVDLAKGEADTVLAQLNPSTGAIEWHKVWGTPSYEGLSELAIAANGDLVLIGNVYEPISFGGSSLAPRSVAVKLSPTGAYLWGWSNNFYFAAQGLALTPSGGVALGTFSLGNGGTAVVLAP